MVWSKEKKIKNYNKTRKIINGTMYKKCSSHHKYFPNEEDNWFPLNEKYFYKWDRSPDGFNARCIKCSIKYARKRREEHGDIVRKNEKKGYYKTKEKHLETIRNYQNKNNGVKQHIKDYQKDYRQTNPEMIRKYSKKRAKKKHIIEDSEWNACKNFFGNACAYCGLPIEEHYMTRNDKIIKCDLHKDHVIDIGRNDIKNCIPSCSSCNDIKKKKTLNQFYNSNNPNYTYERYHKIYLWIRYEYKKYIIPKRRYKNQRMSSRLKEIENNKQNKS